MAKAQKHKVIRTFKIPLALCLCLAAILRRDETTAGASFNMQGGSYADVIDNQVKENYL